MSNNSEIDIDVLLATGSSANDINKVARAVAALLGGGADLEKVYNKLFTGLSANAKTLQGELEGVLVAAAKAKKELGSVPVRELNKRLSTGSTILRGGGIETALETAAQAGAVAKIKNDGAVRQLAAEKATNQVLSARREIYTRIAETGVAQGSTPGQINAAYGRARRSQGDTRNGNTILAEGRRFNTQMLAEAKVASAATLAETVAADAKILAQSEAFYARYERAEAAHLNRMYDLQARAAAKAAPRTDEEIAARSLGIQRARQTAGGGVPFLQTQLGGLAGFAAIAAVVGGITAAARATIQFEASLQEMQAVARATDLEMKGLSTSILDVGANSKFSLKDISDTAITIAQAGYSAGEVAKILPSVNALAAATGSSLNDSAALVTSVLSVYALSVDRTASVVNTLAAAANNSKLTLAQVSTAFQYTGAIAAQTGVKFDELTTSFAAMAQAGAKSGNLIGTGTRQLLTELENPTAKLQKELSALGLTVDDVNIRTQGYAGALKNLKDAGFTAETALKSLDRRAATAYALNYNGIDGFAQFQAKITGTNAAFEAAAIQMKSLQAQTTRLGNSFVEVINTAGLPFITMLAGMAGGLAGVLHGATSLAPAFIVLGTLLGSFAAASLLSWLGKLALGFAAQIPLTAALQADFIALLATEGELGLATEGLALGFIELTAVMLTNPVVLMTAAIAALVAVFFGSQIATGMAAAEIEKHQAASAKAGEEVNKYAGRVTELDAEINTLTDRHARLSKNTNEVSAATATASSKFMGFGQTIEGVGGNVDNLIAKLQHLKGVSLEALAAAQHVKINEDKAAFDAAKEQQRQANYNLSGVARNYSKLPGVQGVLHGDFSPASLAAAQKAAPAGSMLATRADQAVTAYGQAQSLGGAYSSSSAAGTTADLNASPKAQALAAAITAARGRNQNLYSTAIRITDNHARLIALQGVSADAASSRQAIEAQAKGIPGGAQLLTDSSGYHDLQNRSGGSSGPQTEGSLKSQLTLAQAQFQAAKRSGKVADIKKYGGQIASLHTKIADAKALADPESALLSDENVNQADDIKTQGAVDTAEAKAARAAEKARKEAAKEKAEGAKLSAAALKTKMDDLSAETNPDNVDANSAAIADLGQKYMTQVGIETAAGSSKDKDNKTVAAQKMAAALEKARKEVAKSYHTPKEQAASDAAANLEEAAKNSAGLSEDSLRTGAGSLADALAEAHLNFNKVLEAQLQTSNEKFLAKGILDPSQNSDALKDREKIINAGAKAVVETTLALAQATLEGNTLRRASQKFQLDSRIADNRRQLNLSGGPLGMREIGDTHRSLLDLQDRPNQILAAGGVLAQAQGKLADTQANRDDLIGQRDAAAASGDGVGAGKYSTQISKLSIEMETLAKNVRDAQTAFDGLTVHADRFVSVQQALSASIKVFRDANQRPFLEGLADGLSGVFQGAQQSLAGFFTGVLNGTQKAGVAFKALAVNILNSMLDMLAKLAAQQLMQSLLGMVGGMVGGGAGLPAGSFNMPASGGLFAAQGAIVRRAQGGGNPFRDSVNALLTPGEVVMNRSAVSMIGADNLMQMNAAGNSRRSQVQSAAIRPPREPDMTNVYVMAPGAQPSIGKKDVIAYISNDILTGGATKQLIKAVAMGQA